MSIIVNETGPCVVCGSITRLTCSVCRKEYYCGSEHQQIHRRLHKQECFPAKTFENEQCGRYMVATKDIRQGEIIWMEKALVHSPNGGGKGAPTFLPICLGCCKVVDTESICSRCVWPLCGKQCPMGLYHQMMECNILSQNSVIPSGKGEEYDFIKIIRVLLLQELDVFKWNKITALESHMIARSENPRDNQNFSAALEFIHDSCNLKQFDYHQVNFAYGICKINSYSSDLHVPQSCNFRLESAIYYNTSMLSHVCVPNVRLIVVEVSKPQAAFAIQVMAAVPIKYGEVLAYSYCDNSYPTMQRQEILQEHYYFTCQCRRCLDPTELGTYFSGIKCPHPGCIYGFFIPTHPMIPNAPWRCSCCQILRNYSDFTNFLETLKLAIEEAANETSPAVSCAKYEKIIIENLGITVYHGHHDMYTASCHVLVKILDIILTLNDDMTLLQHIAQKLIFYSKRCFQVAEVLNPGLNTTRGKILYYMASGMKLYTLLTMSAFRDDDPIKILQDNEMANAIKEAKRILFMEPEGSAERMMAEVLAKDTC